MSSEQSAVSSGGPEASPVGSRVPLGAHIFAERAPDKPGGKTQRWTVRSKKGEAELGYVGWYGPWRQYNFDPESGTTFNNACLREITAFLERLNREQQQRGEPAGEAQ